MNKESRTDKNGKRQRQRKRNKDIYIATWNVRTLGKPGALRNLKEELKKYKVMVAALQELKWKGNGILQTGEHTLFYSCGKDTSGGTGVLIQNTLKTAVLNFKPVNERICVLRMRARFFNISFVCVYAPTEDAEEMNKDIFYEQLEQELQLIARHDVKVIMGDFNAKVGRENAFRKTAGKESLHETTNNNGLRLVDLAIGNDMIIKSTWLQRKDIRKVTWCSPDGSTKNQIDHVLIDRRHASDILQVDSCRGADGDTDHFLVRVRYRQRIAVYRTTKRKVISKYNDTRLKVEEETAKQYKMEIDNNFSEAHQVWKNSVIEEKWNIMKAIICKTADKILGKKKRTNRCSWFDEECREKVKERNDARKRMLQRKTRATVEEYQHKRKEADKECRKKKREYEKRRITELEEKNSTQDVKKFYMRIKDIKKGFQPRATFCRDKKGNLVGGKDQILERWAEYFYELLNGDADTGTEQVSSREEDIKEEEVINYEDMNKESVPNPNLEEVKNAIKDLRNNKAPGEDNITAEMIKYGGEQLMKHIHEMLVEIWQREEMPEQWRTAIICPIHKKHDKADCKNYRGIALIGVVYKILAKIIARRMAPHVEHLLGDYQCGFRANRSTTDQIFIIRQILDKCYEHNVSVHQLFIDFKQAYDSVRRQSLYRAMKELGIPHKLIKLVEMTLRKTKCKVKVEGETSNSFEVNQGLRQGDVLSTLLFNIALEKVMRSSRESNPGGTFFSRITQNLAYADDVVILSRRQKELEENLIRLEKNGEEMGLKLNRQKTKYMLSTRVKQDKKNRATILNGVEYEDCQSFKYLGTVITDNNNMREEIKGRVAAGNRGYFTLQKVFKSRNLSKNLKLTVYRTVVRPVVTYGSETWTMTETDEELLRRWERKILRRIYGPVSENGNWRIRTNRELEDLYKKPDIVSEIKSNRLRWLGHVERMPEDRAVKKVFRGKPGGRRLRGRPRKRWLDDVEEDLKKMGVQRWRTRAINREHWAGIVREAKALHGL